MKILECVHVTWLDSAASNEWTTLEEIESHLEETHSVGLLLHRTTHSLVLCHSFDPQTDSANGLMSIPMKAVKRIKPVCTIKMKQKK